MDIWRAFRKINWSLMLVLQGEIMWHWLLSTVCSISILAERHGWKYTHEVHWNRNEMGYYPSMWYFLRRWKWKELSHLRCSDLVIALMHILGGNLWGPHLSIVKYVWNIKCFTKRGIWNAGMRHTVFIKIMFCQICWYNFYNYVLMYSVCLYTISTHVHFCSPIAQE